jgi:hypothetical protein
MLVAGLCSVAVRSVILGSFCCLRFRILGKRLRDEVPAGCTGGVDLLGKDDDLVLADGILPVFALEDEGRGVALRHFGCNEDVDFVVYTPDINAFAGLDLE